MSGSYYQEYIKQKQIKEGTYTSRINESIQKKNPPNYANMLTDNQLSAYNWLIAKSIIQPIDEVDKRALTLLLCSNKFQILFKLGSLFGIVTSKPVSNYLSHIKPSIHALVRGLQEKKVLPTAINVDALCKNDQYEVLAFLVSCYIADTAPPPLLEADISRISQWLINIGIEPPLNDKEWFLNTKPLHISSDSLRNGDLFCQLCVVFRPETFNGSIPPTYIPREIKERLNQSLRILADENAIDESDINLTDAIIKGKIDVIITLLQKVHIAYQKRQEQSLKAILTKM